MIYSSGLPGGLQRITRHRAPAEPIWQFISPAKLPEAPARRVPGHTGRSTELRGEPQHGLLSKKKQEQPHQEWFYHGKHPKETLSSFAQPGSCQSNVPHLIDTGNPISLGCFMKHHSPNQGLEAGNCSRPGIVDRMCCNSLSQAMLMIAEQTWGGETHHVNVGLKLQPCHIVSVG